MRKKLGLLWILAGAIALGSMHSPAEKKVYFASPAAPEYFENDAPASGRIIGVRSSTMGRKLSPLESLIVSSINKNNLPSYMDRVFVRTQIHTESGDNPRAVGGAGERGYMQIAKETWETIEKRLPFERWAFDPAKNIDVGVRYLAYIDNVLKRDHPDWGRLSILEKRKLVLGCYNYGITRMAEASWNLDVVSDITKDYIHKMEERYMKFIF